MTISAGRTFNVAIARWKNRRAARDPAELAQIADQAATRAARLARTGIGGRAIDTDRLTVDEVIDALRRQIGAGRPREIRPGPVLRTEPAPYRM